MSAALTTPSFRYQLVKVPVLERAAQDLLVPLVGRPDVLELAPVAEHGEEVGDDLVRHVPAEHVQRGGLAVVEGDVPVLDAHGLPPWTSESYSQMSPAANTPGRRALQARGAAHASALADLQAGLAARAARRASRPAPTTTASAASSRPPRVMTFATRPRPVGRPRSARARRRRGPSRRALRAAPGRSAPTRAPKPRSSVTCSCITIVQLLPIIVSDAATSQPM